MRVRRAGRAPVCHTLRISVVGECCIEHVQRLRCCLHRPLSPNSLENEAEVGLHKPC